MRKYFWWAICGLMAIVSVTFMSWKPANTKSLVTSSAKKTEITKVSSKELFGQYVNNIYNTAQLQLTGMDMAVFQKAVTGYFNLKIAHKLPENSNVITVVDFNKSSREKRMWIIDVVNKKLILNTWVSHGQGSGNDMATAFSNNANSHQSSLGFYVTDDIYFGKHGRSLRLDGMDAGFNSAARSRAIVVHAADYVCQNTINQLGRLGRSHGCPAVSPEVSDLVINTIKGKTMLFITGNNASYASKYLNETTAAEFLYQDSVQATTLAKI
ncbi:murein L,D-transpeptidase catalytic domain family protein [Mucilaginibacter limnophilus]|uniref:Murein L,D-transpeptidase catalytic domain family protein n=1 Tax=Mucilaginibacter limnophilus TaxID=1932778 RepID=A0A3S2X0E8_9SPHI|nr:murein L,D-transpeptidase catalytic domain family protein [Mucilaginibacter limnophilus]RVU02491.1 murein L,D-transpeptidase catalytic domain family protein [Mucilaginibacter limnophilus]